MTLGDLDTLRTSVQSLLKLRGIPHGTLYRLSKVVIRMNEAFEFYIKRCDTLAEQYGTPVENKPGQFHLEGGNAASYYKELADLKQTDADIDVEPVTLAPESEGLSGEDMVELVRFGIVTIKE